MGDRTVNLAAFDVRRFSTKLFNAVVVGKKHTGKSTLIQDILYHLSRQGIPRVCVFSGTEESNGFYKQFVPGTFIFDDKDVKNKLEQIVQLQKQIAIRKQMGEISTGLDTRIVIVLDDVGYKKNVLRSEIIRQMFMNGRHHNLILVVACQYCMDIAVDLRTNADYVFVLKQNSVSSIKNLHENYFGAFEKRREFQTVLEACTQDYQCLVLDNTKPSTKVGDVCFWYKAKYGRAFRIGSPKLWQFHDRWFLSDEQRYINDKQKLTTTNLSFDNNNANKTNSVNTKQGDGDRDRDRDRLRNKTQTKNPRRSLPDLRIRVEKLAKQHSGHTGHQSG